VYAAGDIATFPYRNAEDLIRLEHWHTAEQQGILAAYNMLGIKRKLNIIPHFWIKLAGISACCLGHPGKWDDSIIHGDLYKDDFIIYYTESDTINAAFGVNREAHMALIEELFKRGKMPSAVDLKKKSLSLEDLNKIL
jgi:hypothetical protein